MKRTGRAPKLRAVVFCRWQPAGEVPHQIDPAKTIRNPRIRFCCREHDVLWRRAHGEYKRMAALGNASQARVKAETGHVPKYEKRSQAVAKSNQEHPRRKKAVVRG